MNYKKGNRNVKNYLYFPETSHDRLYNGVLVLTDNSLGSQGARGPENWLCDSPRHHPEVKQTSASHWTASLAQRTSSANERQCLWLTRENQPIRRGVS